MVDRRRGAATAPGPARAAAAAARRATCRGAAISARRPGGSRCCTRWRISNSTRSISPGTSSRGSPAMTLPRAFFDDWVDVAAEEAEHFALLAARLAALGAAYGDLPAHDGLWEAAAATAHDLLARLAVVPLVLEARGLDVTPEMMLSPRTRRRYAKRRHSPPHLRRRDRPCGGRRALVRVPVPRARPRPGSRIPERVRRYFKGALKPPFNRAARDSAGLPAEYYEPLAGAAA